MVWFASAAAVAVAPSPRRPTLCWVLIDILCDFQSIQLALLKCGNVPQVNQQKVASDLVEPPVSSYLKRALSELAECIPLSLLFSPRNTWLTRPALNVNLEWRIQISEIMQIQSLIHTLQSLGMSSFWIFWSTNNKLSEDNCSLHVVVGDTLRIGEGIRNRKTVWVEILLSM